jgi:hypothetical protein
MNKEAVLSFIKTNVLSLICGLVAILAVVAVFYPLGGMVTSLQTDADAAAADYNTINGYTTKQRKLPISDVYQTDPGNLGQFPNKATIALGTDANKVWANYAVKMMKDLVDGNQKGHDLLVADELPLPTQDTTYFTFANLYKLVLSTDPAVTAIGNPNATPPVTPDTNLQLYRQKNLQNDILFGCLPPTIEQIKAAADDLKKNVYEPQLIYKNGVAVNEIEVEQRFTAEASQLPLKMKGDSAKTHKIYVEKDAFTVSPTIIPGQKPAIADMWYAQMQLWIQKDLCTAISQENAASKNVLDAPVKRLISMQIPAAPMYVFPPAAAGGQSTGGVPATAKETDPIPPIYTVSVTGRYSNGMYDVVPFRLVVDVDASKVNEFIEMLSKDDRSITIDSENEYALDAEVESSHGYLYGPDATVRLQLDGEILFMRGWTEKLMPEPVKIMLGLVQGAAGSPGSMQPNHFGGPMGGGMPPMGPGMPPPGQR